MTHREAQHHRRPHRKRQAVEAIRGKVRVAAGAGSRVREDFAEVLGDKLTEPDLVALEEVIQGFGCAAARNRERSLDDTGRGPRTIAYLQGWLDDIRGAALELMELGRKTAGSSGYLADELARRKAAAAQQLATALLSPSERPHPKPQAKRPAASSEASGSDAANQELSP